MSSVKERLVEYLKYKGVSQGKFEKDCGLSNGYINNIRKSITEDKIKLIQQSGKYDDLNFSWLLLNEGEMLKDKEPDTANGRMQKHLNGVKNNKDNSVPIADIDFTGGFVELLENSSHPNIIGKINLPQFRGCDIIVTCQNDSMSDVINPSDFVGIRRIFDFHDLEYGKAIYGVVTNNFRLFKYIDAADKAEYITLKSENKKYTDRTLHLGKILELWVVQAVMPASQIKVYL